MTHALSKADQRTIARSLRHAKRIEVPRVNFEKLSVHEKDVSGILSGAAGVLPIPNAPLERWWAAWRRLHCVPLRMRPPRSRRSRWLENCLTNFACTPRWGLFDG